MTDLWRCGCGCEYDRAHHTVCPVCEHDSLTPDERLGDERFGDRHPRAAANTEEGF